MFVSMDNQKVSELSVYLIDSTLKRCHLKIAEFYD